MDNFAGTRVWVAVSLVGSPIALTALCLLMAGVLSSQRRWVMAVGAIVAQGGGGIINEVLKQTIQRPRPLGAQAYLYGHSWSFPSGHAMGSLIGYGFLCYAVVVCWSSSRNTRNVAIALASTLILAIGISRLALGVHYISDVIGGWSIGAVWLAICVLVLQRVARTEHHRGATV